MIYKTQFLVLKDNLHLFENKINEVASKYHCTITQKIKEEKELNLKIKLKIEYNDYKNDILLMILEELSQSI